MTGKAPQKRPLANLTREDLEPLWSRLDIPTKRIAEALGVTRSGLSHKCIRSLGLPPRTGNKTPMKRGDDALFKRMWEAGVAVEDMRQHFGYAKSGAVTTRRRALGLPPRERSSNGESSSGWKGTIPIEVFFEQEIGRVMLEKEKMNRG